MTAVIKLVEAPDLLPLHFEVDCDVRAQASSIFDYIDRPERLSSHMARRSWQLAGASMAIETDADGGRVVGSHIRLTSRMLGMHLDVECKVMRREPPRRRLGKPSANPIYW